MNNILCLIYSIYNMSLFERFNIDRDVIEYAINRNPANLILLNDDTGRVIINANHNDVVIVIGHNSGVVKICSKNGPPETYVWTTGNDVIHEYDKN